MVRIIQGLCGLIFALSVMSGESAGATDAAAEALRKASIGVTLRDQEKRAAKDLYDAWLDSERQPGAIRDRPEVGETLRKMAEGEKLDGACLITARQLSRNYDEGLRIRVSGGEGGRRRGVLSRSKRRFRMVLAKPYLRVGAFAVGTFVVVGIAAFAWRLRHGGPSHRSSDEGGSNSEGGPGRSKTGEDSAEETEDAETGG